jgi:hypothetical protein
MDQDKVGSDELAGTIEFDTKELIEACLPNSSLPKEKKKNNKFVWKNVYGSPLN